MSLRRRMPLAVPGFRFLPPEGVLLEGVPSAGVFGASCLFSSFPGLLADGAADTPAFPGPAGWRGFGDLQLKSSLCWQCSTVRLL